MTTISKISDLKLLRRQWTGKVAFVPTMGNLHAGHLALVQQAKSLADKVVVSIFVNPLQFAAHEDFDIYPRTLAADMEKLAPLAIDALFVPTEAMLYPCGREQQTQIFVPRISKILCGISRPHFFQGVATVVTKLLNIVQPHIAIFGEKDSQQLAVIKQLAADLNLDCEIIGAPIVRETDGLAMSSRNQYLSATERALAPQLYQQLQQTAEQINKGNVSLSALILEAKKKLENHGFKTDYYEICNIDLTMANSINKDLIILVAAWLGKTRLIDNVKV